MPVWKKVESPMQATTRFFWPLRENAWLKPWPTEKALPMQEARSLALSGAEPPRA